MSDDVVKFPGGGGMFVRRSPMQAPVVPIRNIAVPRDPVKTPARADLTDADRADFLRTLDASQKVTLYDFRLNFVETNLGRTAFSPGQRQVIDDMIRDYAERIGW